MYSKYIVYLGDFSVGLTALDVWNAKESVFNWLVFGCRGVFGCEEVDRCKNGLD